jgi:Ca2+-binding RTX toxin-like protein
MANFYGTDGNDKYDPFWGGLLDGTAQADYIYGYGGDDELFGEGGDDWLDGGLGADYMEGGDGNDTYIVDNVRDVVYESSHPFSDNGGYDTVKSYVSYVLPSRVEGCNSSRTPTPSMGMATNSTMS